MYDVNQLQTVFQKLGDQSRLKIIQAIGKKEVSVSVIVKKTNLSQALVSHHLRVLREENIVQNRRAGPFIYYSVKELELHDLLKKFAKLFGKGKSKKSSSKGCC